MKINRTTVSSLPLPESGRKVYHDDHVRGFCVRVTPSGTKTFYVYKSHQGKPIKIALGVFPVMSPEDARRKALETIGALAAGQDPRKPKTETFGDLFQRYLEDHAKARKKTWREDEAIWERSLAQWSGLSIGAIPRAKVRELHASMKETPVSANRMLALVSKVFEFADEFDIWTGPNPARKVRRFPEKSRTRFLLPEEMLAFFEAVAKEEPRFQDLFLLMLLTGARKRNLLEMEWTELRLSQGRWEIPETKNGESVVVHLPTEAVAILEASRVRQADSTSSYVFPSHGVTGHLQDPKASWNRVREASGLHDVRMHDLRRTLGSWQAEGGSSLQVIGKSLGHKSTAATEIYSRLRLDAVAESVDGAVKLLLRDKPSPGCHPERPPQSLESPEEHPGE